MRRRDARLTSVALLAGLTVACSSIQDAGTADRSSGFDRTAAPAPSDAAVERTGPGGNPGLAALCKVPALPIRTPSQLAVVSKEIQSGISKMGPDTYTPQLAAIVRAAVELMAAVEAEGAFAGVDPAVAASFKANLARRNGSVETNRAKLATACGAKKPG